MLQTIVNIKHFYVCSWDREIFSRYLGGSLFDMAWDEISFWIQNLTKLNRRSFVAPPPSVFGWVDASSVAHGGILCKLKNKYIGLHAPLTADNLLSPDLGLGG